MICNHRLFTIFWEICKSSLTSSTLSTLSRKSYCHITLLWYWVKSVCFPVFGLNTKNTVQKEFCIWILFTQSDVAKRIVLTFLRLNYSLSSQLKLLHSKEEIKKSGCISELTVDGQCNPPGVSATHNTVSVIDAGKNEVRIFMVVHVKLLQTIFIAVDCYFYTFLNFRDFSESKKNAKKVTLKSIR